MKYFKYLTFLEKIFLIFNLVSALFLAINLVVSKFQGLGVGGLFLLYTLMQTTVTLRYRALLRIPKGELTGSDKKWIDDIEGWKKLWSGLTLKGSLIWWIVTIVFNFVLSPVMLPRLGN